MWILLFLSLSSPSSFFSLPGERYDMNASVYILCLSTGRPKCGGVPKDRMCQPHSSHQKLLQGAVNQKVLNRLSLTFGTDVHKHCWCNTWYSLFSPLLWSKSCVLLCFLYPWTLCSQTLYLHTVVYFVLFWDFPVHFLFCCSVGPVLDWSICLVATSGGSGQLTFGLKAPLFVAQLKVISQIQVVRGETGIE